MLVTYPPPIAPSLTPAYLRRVAETDVDNGFPKSQRGSSGMSEIHHDKGSMTMCAKPAGKQQRMTHTSSHEDIVPRRSRMHAPTGERAEAASEAAVDAVGLASAGREAD